MKKTQVEATTHQNRPGNRNWIIATYVLFIVGMIVFLTHAIFDYIPAWDKIYYLWDKTKDLLFLICIYRIYPFLRGTTKYIIIFAILRLLWEVITIIIHVSPNHAIGVNTLWLILVGFTVFLSIKEMYAEWKQR